MNKFRSRLYLLILALLALAFSIVMAVLMEKSMSLVSDEAKLIYYITKGLATLALLGMTLYAVFLKKDPANLVIQFVLTIAYQLLPLLIRFMMTRSEPLITWSVIIIFIVSIIYLALVFSLDLLNTKVKNANLELEGKTIPVIDEDNYYDENGRFTGATMKNKEK